MRIDLTELAEVNAATYGFLMQVLWSNPAFAAALNQKDCDVEITVTVNGESFPTQTCLEALADTASGVNEQKNATGVQRVDVISSAVGRVDNMFGTDSTEPAGGMLVFRLPSERSMGLRESIGRISAAYGNRTPRADPSNDAVWDLCTSVHELVSGIVQALEPANESDSALTHELVSAVAHAAAVEATKQFNDRMTVTKNTLASMQDLLDKATLQMSVGGTAQEIPKETIARASRAALSSSTTVRYLRDVSHLLKSMFGSIVFLRLEDFALRCEVHEEDPESESDPVVALNPATHRGMVFTRIREFLRLGGEN